MYMRGLFNSQENVVFLTKVSKFTLKWGEMGRVRGGGLGWQEGGEEQITVNVLHCNTYDKKILQISCKGRKPREQQKTNEMRDCA